MAKVFSFTSVLRKNMMEKDKPDLYYALAKSSGEIDIDEMAERIQRSSTVNWADVVCVLRALHTEMIDSFKKGEIVRLGNIGSFYVTLRSNGVLVQKDVKEGLIKGARVRFRPGKQRRRQDRSGKPQAQAGPGRRRRRSSGPDGIRQPSIRYLQIPPNHEKDRFNRDPLLCNAGGPDTDGL